MLQQAREADPHLERVHPALARGVTVAAIRDGDIGRCYRGCIGREVERTVAVVVPGREGFRERGLGVGGLSSVVVGGHFGGRRAGASCFGVRPLARLCGADILFLVVGTLPFVSSKNCKAQQELPCCQDGNKRKGIV